MGREVLLEEDRFKIENLLSTARQTLTRACDIQGRALKTLMRFKRRPWRIIVELVKQVVEGLGDVLKTVKMEIETGKIKTFLDPNCPEKSRLLTRDCLQYKLSTGVDVHQVSGKSLIEVSDENGSALESQLSYRIGRDQCKIYLTPSWPLSMTVSVGGWQ